MIYFQFIKKNVRTIVIHECILMINENTFFILSSRSQHFCLALFNSPLTVSKIPLVRI